MTRLIQSIPQGKSYVACRPINQQGAGSIGHCGIRVYDPSRSLDVTIELLTDDQVSKEIYWLSAPEERMTQFESRGFAGRWHQVDIPVGMSEQDFDDAVLQAALVMTTDK